MSDTVKVERVSTGITLLQSTIDAIDTAVNENRFPGIRDRSAFLEYAALRVLHARKELVRYAQNDPLGDTPT